MEEQLKTAIWMEHDGHIGFIIPSSPFHPINCAYLLVSEAELNEYRDKIGRAVHGGGITYKDSVVASVKIIGWDYGHAEDLLLDFPTEEQTRTPERWTEFFNGAWNIDKLKRDWTRTVERIFKKESKVEEAMVESAPVRKKIIKNAFRCKKCGETVESRSVHDSKQCKCGNFTDGGLDYIHRGGNLEDMEDMCEYE